MALSTIVGGFWKLYNQLMKRFSIQDTVLTNILQELSAMKAGRVGYMTVEQCRFSSDAQDKKTDSKINEVKVEIYEEIEAVERRLVVRIEKLESK